MQRVKSLLRLGRGDHIADDGGSRFGRQTGETHGGLLFALADAFFHSSPASSPTSTSAGCYAAIIGGVSLYVGQPVVHEPGSGGMR